VRRDCSIYSFDWRVILMLVLKLKEARQQAMPPRKIKLRWALLLSDLSLFMSLTLARLIVWLTLRRRRRERAAVRRKLLAHSPVR
jgi:hypothetical protein